MLFRNELDELLAFDQYPAVSIYLPTHPAGGEVRQDAIRLRNLLSTAVKRLVAAGKRAPEAEALLEPARKLVDDKEFWRYQEQGLAVFIGPGFFRVHKLPIAAPEELLISNHFGIKPLLPLINPAGSFWVLAISASHARLYQGSRWTFAEVPGLDLPQGISEIWGETEYEEAHKASPTGRNLRASGGVANPQAFGETPGELHTAQLIELLHRIITPLEPVIRRQPAPVILAAEPKIQGNFRELAKWKELLPDGILEFADAMPTEDLHCKAWAVFAPLEEQNRAEALDRLRSLLGNRGKATTETEEIIKGARYGRIESLFLSDGQPLWGFFNESEDRVVAHREAIEGDDDLLGYAALMTLRQGGNVIVVDRTQLPPDGPAAAILRY